MSEPDTLPAGTPLPPPAPIRVQPHPPTDDKFPGEVEMPLVDHLEEGRKFLYRPVVSMNEVTRSMTGDLVDRLFDGSLAEVVSHLLDSREVSREELDCLEQLIQQRKSNR